MMPTAPVPMPAAPMPMPTAPMPMPTAPMPPPGRLTLWKSETGNEWLAFLRWGSFQTCMVRATREQALLDMTRWWAEHTAEGQALTGRAKASVKP